MSKVIFYVGTNHNQSAGVYRYQLDTLKGTIEGGSLYYDCSSFQTFHYSRFELLVSAQKENDPAVIYLDCHQEKPYQMDKRMMTDSLDCDIIQADQFVYTANDISNIITVYKKEGGKLRLVKRIKLKENTQCKQILIYENIIYIVCKGSDMILRYDKETLEPSDRHIELARGSAPEALLIHQSGEYLYILSKEANEIYVYKIGKHGTYRCQQICSLLPKGWRKSCISRKMLLSPNGKYLYVLIDGVSAVACFEIVHGNLKECGMMESGGLNPYDALIDETGRWMLVLHKDSDNLIVFEMNPESGEAIKITDEKILSCGMQLTWAYRI